MRKMPWYTNPVRTCKVLNRIARHYENSSLQNLRFVMDHATESIWRKQETYYERHLQQQNEVAAYCVSNASIAESSRYPG